MAAVHHIQRQRLILEAEVSAATAGRWHARLEELHESNLLPVIDRELTALADEEVVVIERLEVALEVDDPEQLESVIAEQFPRALRKAIQALKSAETDKKEVSFFQDIISFFRTGNLGWRAGNAENFFGELPRQAEHWTQEQWVVLFQLFAEQPNVVFGRCTQVQGEFLRLARTQLEEIAQAQHVDSEAMKQVFEEQDKHTSSRWKKALGMAGFGEVISADKPQGSLSSLLNPEIYGDVFQEESTQYYVPNAGLVILHPYLKYMVEKLGVLQNRTLKGLEKPAPGAASETLRGPGSPADENLDLPRMAALLHYAVSGEAEFREWEHPLTKLLLGLEPTDPLIAGPLSSEDRAFVDELLRGIIEHWSALGNTSVEALREAFLQRPGRLGREAGGWSLRVESRPYDLLLQKLPWGIGMIKSPWMTDLLQVDWS